METLRQVSMMSSVKVECVVKGSALIGEGPVWEESSQALLFVDIAGQKIHRWSPATDRIQSVETGQTRSRSHRALVLLSFGSPASFSR